MIRKVSEMKLGLGGNRVSNCQKSENFLTDKEQFTNDNTVICSNLEIKRYISM